MVSTPARLNRWRAAQFQGLPGRFARWPPPRRLVILRHHGGAGRSRRTGAPLPGPVARPDDGACQRSGDGRGDRADAPPHGLRAAGRRDLGPRRHGERQPVGGRAGVAAGDAGQRHGRRPSRRAGGGSASRGRLGLADGDDDRARSGRAADAGRLGRRGRHAAQLAAAGLGRAGLPGGPAARLGTAARRRLAGRGLGAAASRRSPRRAPGRDRPVRRLGTAARRPSRLGAAAELGVSRRRPAGLGTAARRQHRSTGRSDGGRAGRHTRCANTRSANTRSANTGGARTAGAGERR